LSFSSATRKGVGGARGGLLISAEGAALGSNIRFLFPVQPLSMSPWSIVTVGRLVGGGGSVGLMVWTGGCQSAPSSAPAGSWISRAAKYGIHSAGAYEHTASCPKAWLEMTPCVFGAPAHVRRCQNGNARRQCAGPAAYRDRRLLHSSGYPRCVVVGSV
jgi:hypothetical protein